ncbi:MAG: 4-phosphoerythronate dehydrogenase [Gammaproteobacteria bacterium]|nr:4-phosphoerythronate dehydrogenase [Gammaproteobacteria bacterium]
MKIIADENIAEVKQAFASLGDVHLKAGRTINAVDVENADILLVRSVTPVNAALLKNSKVRFVASATIGTDHVDLDYLAAQGIGFAHAPGCNANAVAEYVLSALCHVLQSSEIQKTTIGIIGNGNVGSRLAEKLNILGWQYKLNDPFLAAQDNNAQYVSLDEIIETCDVISLHVPLTHAGLYPTQHLFNAARINKLKSKTVLINTARGAVIDNEALNIRLQKHNDLRVVLDVWEHEPHIAAELLSKVKLATPHIAGYSVEGKLRGTEQIYHAAWQYCMASTSLPPAWYKPVAVINKQIALPNNTPAALCAAYHALYDIAKDDEAMRTQPLTATRFDELRKHYTLRNEAPTLQLLSHVPQLEIDFAALGFAV